MRLTTFLGLILLVCFLGFGGYVLTDQLSLDLLARLAPVQLAQVGQNQNASWVSPVGIPTPPFGLTEEPPTLPTPWATGIAGFYYVDNTHPQATDSANPYGYPAKPRKSIPGNLLAGDYVEIHGGPYSTAGSGFRPFAGVGTAANPIFIKGVGNPRFTSKLMIWNAAATESKYMIFDGISVYKFEINAPASYIVLRNSEVTGDAVGGGVQIASFVAGQTINNVLIWNNEIHDNGNWQAENDQDVHGVSIANRVNNVWILENEFYHNSGDGVQINAGSAALQPDTHHIYLGRNESHHNKQSGMWTKQATDVIFSENVIHDLRPIGSNPSAYGAGMGYQYGPEYTWFINNHIYDSSYGIASGGSSGGTGQNTFLIGNLIHNIHRAPNNPLPPSNSRSSAGIALDGVPGKNIINNTIYDVDAGINLTYATNLNLQNNLISNVTEPEGNHIFIESTAGTLNVANNLLYQNGGAPRIKLANQVQTITASNCANCLNVDPKLTNVASGNFSLLESSPAKDAGVVADAYQIFANRYGIDIRRDITGGARPQGSAWDIGAYEYGSGGAPLPNPTTYNIIATASAGGSITPSGTVSVAEGESRSFTITPSAGYVYDSLRINNQSVATTSTYTFSNVRSNGSLHVVFTPITVAVTPPPATTTPPTPTNPDTTSIVGNNGGGGGSSGGGGGGGNSRPSASAPSVTPVSQAPAFAPLTSLFALNTSGAHVSQLQQMLSVDGYYTGAITGRYDQATIQAVQKFQTKFGLLTSGSADTNGFGFAGPATRAKLNELYTGQMTPVLSERARLELVRGLQVKLLGLLQQLLVLLTTGS